MKKYLGLLENSLSLFMMFSFALILFLFLLLPANTNANQEISLSDLAKKVQSEEVESISVESSSSKVNIKLKDGSYLYSSRDPEVSLEESLLYYGVNASKIKGVDIKIKESSQYTLIFESLSLSLFPVILFFVLYFVILAGFKILHIKNVPRQKISIYIFIVFLYSLFLSPAITTTVYRHIIENRFVVFFLNSIFFYLATFLIFRYYFLLFGKKLWQFFLYFIIVGLIFSFTINLLLPL